MDFFDFLCRNFYRGCIRFFDFKSFNYQTVNIWKYDKNDTTNLIYLKTDERKTYTNYYTVNELNGRFMIDFENGNDPDLEADYGFVHFSLKYNDAIVGGDLYLLGAFSDWKFKD